MFFYSEPDIVTQDPYFYNTSLLLNMDSDFSDSSVNNHAVTVNGNTSISSTESKFGGGSGYFDGNGDDLQFSDSEKFNFGSEDFTIECWVYPTQNVTPTAGTVIYSQSTAGAASDSAIYTGISLQGLALYITDGVGWDYNVTYTDTISQQWHHVVFERYGSALKLFLNGVNVANTTIPASFSIGNSSRSVFIGRQENNPTGTFAGYIDDLRVTKGVARYTANFTPPTEAHPTTGPSE